MIAYLDPRAEQCPHPASRRSCTIQVQGGRRAMQLCLTCKRTFEGLIEAWAGRQVSPRAVVATVRRLGYTRRDAAAFLLQLCTGSLRGWLHVARA